MTDARKALESAREALKLMADMTGCRADDEYVWGVQAEVDAAIAALASGEQPVAYIERSVLAHLAKDKHATATVCSGLLRAPFGDKVALFTMPTPPAPETRS